MMRKETNEAMFNPKIRGIVKSRRMKPSRIQRATSKETSLSTTTIGGEALACEADDLLLTIHQAAPMQPCHFQGVRAAAN